tara:strand:+ start:6253 stop:6552 length:300 start_codon:yes stop_codon:yes gene_type:complete
MIYYVDIDGTICTSTEGDYEKAEPFMKNIKKINKLYDEGNEVVYWTARGSVTGKDWTELTTNQLEKWGVKYHKLMLGKPHYELFICDKAVNSRDFFNDK